MYQVLRFLTLVPLVFFLVFYGGLALFVGPLAAIFVLLLIAGAAFSDPAYPGSSASTADTMACGEFSPGWCDWVGESPDRVLVPSDLFSLTWGRLEEMLGMPIWIFLLSQLVIIALCWLAYVEAGRRQQVRIGALAIERLYEADQSYVASLKAGAA